MAAAMEENSLTLEFGEDFSQQQCLLLSEVSVLLQHQKEQRDIADEDAADYGISNVFNKSLAYSTKFSQFLNRESLDDVRRILNNEELGLHQFEIASIANLIPDDASEAKSLIPSLERVNDDQLQVVLEEISNLRSY